MKNNASSSAARAVAFGATLLVAGCLGDIGADNGESDASGSQPSTCAPRLPRRIVLLPELQFMNAVRDLLGPEAVQPDIDPAVNDVRRKLFSKQSVKLGTSLVSTRADKAEFAAKSLTGRFEAVTGCAPAGDDACAKAFLTRFIGRAFRRAVAADELDALWAVYETGKETSFERGVQLAIEAILTSPSFTYRTELGEDTGGQATKLSPHEIASELSFFLTDSLPDEELAAAADSGALRDPAELLRQTERMLQEPETRATVITTLLSAWRLGNLITQKKTESLFPEWNAQLIDSMYHESELFIDEMMWSREEDVSALLTSNETFVNEPLAKLYGVEKPGGAPEEFALVSLPEDQRAGLLTQSGFLATQARTDATSVVARGLFVRNALLCMAKISRPSDKATNDKIEAQLATDTTEVERAEYRAMTQPCSSCHAGFDRFGLVLENFDPIGRYRETLNGEPIRSTVDLDGLGSFKGTYSSAVGVANALVESDEFAACLTNHLVSYGTDDQEVRPEDCQVADVVKALPPEGRTLPNIVKAIVTSSALTERVRED